MISIQVLLKRIIPKCFLKNKVLILDFKFDNNTYDFMKILAKNALRKDVRVFFVGGAVRDLILGCKTKDIDFLIQGNAIDFSKSLGDDISLISIHDDFSTVKVSYLGKNYDIASSRVEAYPFSGCLPVVRNVGVDIKDDVIRRDFSINSLYVEFFIKNDTLTFQLIDLVDGVKDIKNKVLRVLHNKSYIDDPTRILRGLEYKYRFGFEFSKNDNLLIRDCLSNIDYCHLSIDRAYAVLKKILLSNDNNKIFRDLIEQKYYKIFTAQNLDIDFVKISNCLDMFSLNPDELSEFYINIIKSQAVKRYEIKSKVEMIKIFSKLDKSYLAYYYYKTSDNNVLLFNKIKDIKLNITGYDLIMLNYPEGELIGRILSSLLEKKLSNFKSFLTKDDELGWVKKNFPLF